MDELVKKITQGKHRIILEPRTKELREIKERLAEGFIFVKFLETQGETELGIDVDHKMTQLSEADFDSEQGILKLVGTCELNFTKACFNADINLATRQGLGFVEILN